MGRCGGWYKGWQEWDGISFDGSPSIEFNEKLEPFFSTGIHRAVIELRTVLTIKISVRTGMAEFIGALFDKISRKRGKLRLGIEQERTPPE